MEESLDGRTVVVSPHLDDAVFSLGATIAHASKSGGRVEVLTVFGCEPESRQPANGWDTRSGFSTEGEAATARREEDREACRFVGAEPQWLAFRGGGYTPDKDSDAIFAAIAEKVSGADAVLIPGFPLKNDDHAWLARLFDERPLPARVGRYVEQPYAYTVRKEQALLGAEWEKSRVTFADRLRKRRAVGQYTSQLALLSFGPRKLGLLVLQDEAISWGAG
ncbi:MAG: PIG-L deacetylase family protein [Gaiellaceae bacterium]